jgi:hypothetical protein
MSNAEFIIWWIVIIAAYWAPAVTAWVRHVPNKGSVTVVNALLGWTLVGWVIALAMSCRSRPDQVFSPPNGV